MIGEKKISKTFQYDLPGDLVLTYLSEVRNKANNMRLFACVVIANPNKVRGV